MGKSHRSKSAIVALLTLLASLVLLSQQGLAAEPPRIIEGSNVTFFYQITVPEKEDTKSEMSVSSSRDNTSCFRLWNGWS